MNRALVTRTYRLSTTTLRPLSLRAVTGGSRIVRLPQLDGAAAAVPDLDPAPPLSVFKEDAGVH